MALCIELPWPGPALSPNGSHGHWAAKRDAKKRYRDACCIATLEAARGLRLPDGPLHVRLVFAPPPDGRRRDRDNLVARCKAGLDGVAQALGIDDSRFAEVSATVAEPATLRLLARVSVTITGAPHGESSDPRAARHCNER